MTDEFKSTPYDGGHSTLNPGNDWRTGAIERFTGYGNWAGPGNRMDHDPAFAQRMKDRGPGYDPYEDKELMARPEYKAIDGMDAAAQTHDHGYFKHLDEAHNSMFGWDGMHQVRNDDRDLSRATQNEMDTNGGKYSTGAQAYSQALRGFFGGRAAMQDGIDWAGNKAGEASTGLADFGQGLRNSTGVGDAASKLGHGVMDAGRWGLNTLGQGAAGVGSEALRVAKLGPVGMLGEGLAGLNVAGAGAVHLGSMAVDGLKPIGQSLANGAARVGGQVWDGAKSLGNQAVAGVSNAASAAGTAISNGATATMNGARQVGSAVVNTASNAASAIGNGVSSAASAVGNGASAVGGAIAGGASRAWKWLGG